MPPFAGTTALPPIVFTTLDEAAAHYEKDPIFTIVFEQICVTGQH